MAKTDNEVTRRFREAISVPLPPEVQAAEDARIRAFMESLPDASGTFSGHLVTDDCYDLGGCEDGCPVWVEVHGNTLNPN